MKRKIIIAMVVFVATSTIDAQKYYESISLKTNLLSFWNVGVEFPVMRNYSLELNTRRYGSNFFSETFKRDKRVHLKYHFDMPALQNQGHTAYFLVGLHHKYQIKYDNSVDNGFQKRSKLNTLRAVAGVGLRYKYLDFWVAAESSLFESHNGVETIETNGNVYFHNKWKPRNTISIGLNYNFLNFNIEKRNSGQYKSIGAY